MLFMGGELDGETTFHYRHHVCFIILRVHLILRLDFLDPAIRKQTEMQTHTPGLQSLGKFESPELFTSSSVANEMEWTGFK